MSIAILCGKDTEQAHHYQPYAKSFSTAITNADPMISVQTWPDITHPNDVEMALVWDYAAGELNKLHQLKCIVSLGAGVDHIMSDDSLPTNIPVVRIVDKYMVQDITQYVVATTLHYIKRFDHWDKCATQGEWAKQPPFKLDNIKVGIMGLGNLGGAAAKALSQLGITVSGWSRKKKNLSFIQSFSGKGELELFLSQTDILVCMLPLTPSTENILNHETFSQLPFGSYVINLGRGNHLVDNDLLGALETGQIAGATLDVFRQEPLPKNHPFWQHPNIRITPHIASVTNPKTAAKQIIENYHRLQLGKRLLHEVDIKAGY